MGRRVSSDAPGLTLYARGEFPSITTEAEDLDGPKASSGVSCSTLYARGGFVFFSRPCFSLFLWVLRCPSHRSIFKPLSSGGLQSLGAWFFHEIACRRCSLSHCLPRRFQPFLQTTGQNLASATTKKHRPSTNMLSCLECGSLRMSARSDDCRHDILELRGWRQYDHYQRRRRPGGKNHALEPGAA